MARFAVVAPVNIVEQLEQLGLLGGAHLLLAHDVVLPQNQERYYRLFHPEGRKGAGRDPLKDRIVIMDNSVIELGHAVDPLMLQEASNIVEATHTVLPDVLEDSRATLASCMNALLTWERYALPPYIMVPQGATLTEFAGCAQAFAQAPIDMWGVPRNLVKLHGSRKGAIKSLQTITPERRIHMMGFSDNLIDDIECAQYSNVTTIDSAVPLRASRPMMINPQLPSASAHEPRGDWWQHALFHPIIPQNLKQVRRWTNGGGY